MGLGVTDDHVELQRTIRRFAEEQLRDRARAALDEVVEPRDQTLGELSEMGLVSMHVGEAFGGDGASLLELCLIIEELGRVVAPGGFLMTTLALDLLERGLDEVDAKDVIGEILGGAIITVAMPGSKPSGLIGTTSTEGITVSGTLEAVFHGVSAQWLLAPVSVEGAERMALIALHGDVVRTEHVGLDPTRRVSTLTFHDVAVSTHRILSIPMSLARSISLVVCCAEITGGARACLELATEHAKTRVQFGRPIGQFQGVKHRLADVMVLVEQMTAATWDAALALEHVGDPEHLAEADLCAAVAASLCLDGGVKVVKDVIQVLGGMGFTWEHDAHLYLRRATVLRSLLGPARRVRQQVSELALHGTRRALGIDLPQEAEAIREKLRSVFEQVVAASAESQVTLMGELGLLFPHWPEPYGRGAGPIEQLVIDEMLMEYGLRRPPAHVTAWALPTLIAHGTIEQQERYVIPSLRGEFLWCQLFSEPGAGSDLASLSTKAVKVDGGWQINGQKVWTSVAQWANYGILLTRTNPNVPKHHGITYFVLDMKSPGVDIRPLREITGDSLFNEVFLDNVFIPDENLVGEVDEGWKLARTTLANERVALSNSSAFGEALETALALVGEHHDPETYEAMGRLLIDAQSLSQMRQRSLLRSVFGLEPGPEASLAKLLGAEHDQRVADFGVELLGPIGITASSDDGVLFTRQMLHTLCLTIAGGTSEVQRNVIGERLLGLPRDPEPQIQA